MIPLKKTWRHLNFFEHETYLHARVSKNKNYRQEYTQNKSSMGRSKTLVFTLLLEAFILQFAKHLPVNVLSKNGKKFQTTKYGVF